MLAMEGFWPLCLPVEMIRSGWICSTDSPFRLPTEHGVQHVVGDGRRPVAVLGLGTSVQRLSARTIKVG